MKLQPALIFGEHLVLQRNKPIPVWGNSVCDDEVSVCLNGVSKTVHTDNGKWYVEFEKMDATFKTQMSISSKKTGEAINFNDIAIGEVWLAGGQSNMEFLLKYDIDYEEAKNLEDDHYLRCFTYPQTAYLGFMEKEILGEYGYWRSFEDKQERGMFSAIGAYMGKKLREQLNVPVGIISCNWGGTPAVAWIAKEDIESNQKLHTVLSWQEEAEKNINWSSYIKTSQEVLPEPTQAQKAFTYKFMMGEDMSEFFKAGPPPMDPNIYNSYSPGPLACIRPSGLYDMMLSKVAPYALSGFVWWQGEDDDARDWVDFYDESMKTLIESWRKLWKQDLPFFQIELAPFRGIGVTGAKKYDVLRHKQFAATAALDNAYDICILDAGEEFNIHPRHKKIVGNRLANMVLKYAYGLDINADCPLIRDANRTSNSIELYFDNTYGEIKITDKIKKYLFVKDGENNLDYEVSVNKDILVLTGKFDNRVTIEYCETNYCEASIFNAEGNPVFGFKVEI